MRVSFLCCPDLESIFFCQALARRAPQAGEPTPDYHEEHLLFGRPVEVHEEVRRGRRTLPRAPGGLRLSQHFESVPFFLHRCFVSRKMAVPLRFFSFLQIWTGLAEAEHVMGNITKRPWIPWWAWRNVSRTRALRPR